MGLPEQLHLDQGAQFESQLMAEFCQLWKTDNTKTTPYHPQSNGVVERNNRGLGHSLQAMLLDCGQDEWDTFLLQLMRAFRGTPHTTTGETANFMMFGRELRLPDSLIYDTPGREDTLTQEYAANLLEQMEAASEILQTRQKEIRTEDNQEPLLFKIGDQVWLENKRRRKGENQNSSQNMWARLRSLLVGETTCIA